MAKVNINQREGLNTSEMGRLSKAFAEAEGSAEERWAAAKKAFPDVKGLDAGFKAWVFKQNGVPLEAPKQDPKAKPDPLK